MFSNLHVHSAKGSLLDSIITVKDLVSFAKENGQRAVALTDHGKMSAFCDLQKECRKQGIKAIHGCEIYCVHNMNERNDSKAYTQERFHMVLLAKNKQGLLNLFKIVSIANTEGFYKKPLIDLDRIERDNLGNNIICLTACMQGELSRLLERNCKEDAISFSNRLDKIFDNVFYEIQSHNNDIQIELNKKIIDLAETTNHEVVVTCDAHMVRKDQEYAHSVFVRISQDRDVGESYNGCYLQTEEEVKSNLSIYCSKEHADIIISNTNKVVDLIDDEIDIGLDDGDKLPEVDVPEEYKNNHTAYLKSLCYQTFDEKFGFMSEDEQQIRKDRVEFEIEVLEYLGYIDYFIMLYMLSKEADSRGIPRGYSRGSGGNVLCLYLLNVTQIDSVKYNLDFSRFGSKGRKGKGMADFDFDISRSHRQDMLKISADLFGKDNIASIATFNSLSTKVAIKDIGKVYNEDPNSPYYMQIPYEIRDTVAKAIPVCKTLDDLGEEIEKETLLKDVLLTSKELQDYYKRFPLWFKCVCELEGLPKSMGSHAAGCIISPKPVVEFEPLCYNKDGNIMAQCDMETVLESLHQIKMDFLGLETLDVVDNTLKFIGKTWKDFDINHLDLNDQNIYKAIYCSGDTDGIFQMESFECKQMCKQSMANNINDIIAINAFNRPGTKDGFPEYCKNKLNPQGAKVVHPDLKKIFENSHYVLLYQEQALQLFRYAGFPEDEVDNARRAIGHKEKEKMVALKDKFEQGLKAKGWEQNQIDIIWELMVKQSSYCFNAGHSTAYGLLSYLTAYLKYYYPEAFMCSLLISNVGDNGKISRLISECKKKGIEVLPPHINRSNADFTLYRSENSGNKSSILFGLNAITGLGSKVAESIISSRSTGKYTGLEDVLSRVDLSKDQVVALIKSGAIPCRDKKAMLLRYAEMVAPSKEFPEYKPVKSLPTQKELKEKWGIDVDVVKDREERVRLFNERKKAYHDTVERQEFIGKIQEKIESYKKDFADKYMQDEDFWEFETLNIFLKDNPFEAVYEYVRPIEDIEDGDRGVVVGIISNITKKIDKRNHQYAHMQIYSAFGIVEVTSWSSDYAKYMNLYSKKNKVAIQYRKDDGHLICCGCKPFKEWYETDFAGLKNIIDSGAMPIYK